MEEEGRGLKRLRQQSHNADRSSRASSGPPAVALSSAAANQVVASGSGRPIWTLPDVLAKFVVPI